MIAPIGNYVPISTLGVGATGKVKLARHKSTSQLVALKIIHKHVLHNKPHLQQKIRREIAIMKLVAANSRHIQRLSPQAPQQHVGILNLIDVYHTDTSIVLVLEYCQGGELFDYLVQRGHLPQSQVLHFFQQLVFALQFCHNRAVCHRDLKPENVLLTADGRVKLADFGMAAITTPGALMATSCGSPQYCAPEVLLGEPYEGCAADVWSLGVVLFAMTTGGLPFDDDNLQRLICNIRSGAFYIPPDVPKPVAELMQAMLCVDPARRITLKQIQKLPWFNSEPCRADVYSEDQFSVAHIARDLVDAPVSQPDAQILRYLADLGLGDFPTLRRRLASQEPCLERNCYFQYAELDHRALEFRQLDEIPMSPLTISHDNSPKCRDAVRNSAQKREECLARSVKHAVKDAVKDTANNDSQLNSDVNEENWTGRDYCLDFDVRWFAEWRAALPSESEHESVASSILQLPHKCATQPSFPSLALR